MLRLGFIGSGNVAWNLAGALHEHVDILQVISRTEDSAKRFAGRFSVPAHGIDPAAIGKDLDLVVIATSDHVIADIAKTYAPFRGESTAFVHTSGSIALEALAPLGDRTGVFYPLQTFTKNHQADFRNIPFFLEGAPPVMEVIRPLADLLSDRVQELDSKGRLTLHLGAVFASNFANFMWVLAEEALKGREGLDLTAYAPLIRECVDKALTYGPRAAHTGPALRGDQVTMDKHLSILQEQDPERAELYGRLSRMISERLG